MVERQKKGYERRVERQLKMEGEDGERASFNIKQHGEKFNVPFMDLFACL